MFDIGPISVLLGTILLLAVYTDLIEQHIPNVLTLGGAIIGVFLSVFSAGTAGGLASVVGYATGLGLFLPFYLLRRIGASDVKLMATVGAFVGPKAVLVCGGVSLISAAALTLIYLTARGSLLRAFQALSVTLHLSEPSRHLADVTPMEAAPVERRFPSTLSVCLGTVASFLWANMLASG